MTRPEPFWSVPGRLSQHPGDERHIAFMRGADLVIHDAQYTEEEYRDKVGWGHSPLEYAVDVALAAGARRLVLFPHDPQHDDAAMERIESAARARAAPPRAGTQGVAARRGVRARGAGPRGRRGRGVVHRLPRPALQPTDAAGGGPRLALAHAGGRRRFPRPTAGPGRGCRPPVALRGPARVGAALRVTHERGARAAAGAGVRGSLRGGSLDPPGERSARSSLPGPLRSRAGARDHPQQPRRGDPERVRRG